MAITRNTNYKHLSGLKKDKQRVIFSYTVWRHFQYSKPHWMQISINDLGHVIRILLIKLLLHNVLTIECLRGLVYGCSYIGSFTYDGILFCFFG